MQKLFFLFFLNIISIVAAVQAQSPYRIFTLDCNLNTASERLTASLVTKAFLLKDINYVKDSKKLKPFAPMDWKAFERVIDTLYAKLPADDQYSWEEDYGLKTDGEKSEKWKEITFYYADFPHNDDIKAILKAKRQYIMQIRVRLDLNGQIEKIEYVQGKAVRPREAFILHSYKILYKPKK